LTAQNIHYTNQQWKNWSDHVDQIEGTVEATYVSGSCVQKTAGIGEGHLKILSPLPDLKARSYCGITAGPSPEITSVRRVTLRLRASGAVSIKHTCRTSEGVRP